MPRFKIETSLFEPVTVEVEGGRTFESVPLSPALIREISKLDEKRKAKTLDDFSALTQQVAMIFGVDVSEIEKIDIRVLNQILEYSTTAMATSQKKLAPLNTMTVDKATALPAVPVDEAEPEKNAPKAGPDTSQ